MSAASTYEERELERIEREAGEWLAIMVDKSAAPEGRAGLDDWLAADPRHREAYATAVAIWTALDDMPELDGAELGTPDFAVSEASRDARPSVRRGRPAGVAAAGLAAAAMLAVAVFVGARMVVGSGAGDVEDAFTTATAELRELWLEDGSVVTLGAESRIVAHFTENERRVTLLRGDAFFDVTSDIDRPFFVEAGDTTVRVVGTQFDVRRTSEAVRVGVLEGVVEVSHRAEARDGVAVEDVARVPAGGSIMALAGAPLPGARAVERAVPGAWRDGRLIYESAPLSQVIADADRYFPGEIRMASADLGALTVSASFRTEDIPRLVDALTATLPLASERRVNGDIVLRSAEDR